LNVKLLLAACALAVAAGRAAGSAQQTTPTFPSGVELITIDAVVLDRNGVPVAGLTRDDFVVSEDGQPQPIVSFEAFTTGDTGAPPPPPPLGVASNEALPPSPGRGFALVLDDMGMSVREAADVRRAVATFLERSVTEGDEVTITTVSGDAWWTARLPDGRGDLLAVTGRLKGRAVDLQLPGSMSDYEAFWIHNRGSSAQDEIMRRLVDRYLRDNLCEPRDPGFRQCIDQIRSRAGAADERRRVRTRLTLQAIRRALDGLGTTRGRKSLLLFSPGFLEDQSGELRDVVTASRLANTAVYFLDARGLVATPGAFSVSQGGPPPNPQDAGAMAFEGGFLESAGAQGLALDTGGAALRNTDLVAGAGRVAAESRTFYLLGVAPPAGKRDDAWRALKVEVKRGGVTVRARRGYTLRGATEPPRAAERGQRSLHPTLARALDSGQAMAGIPLRAMAYVQEPRPKGAARVVVAAEFDSTALAVDGQGRRVEVGIVVTHRDTGRAVAADLAAVVRLQEGEAAGWRTLVREFDVPAGVVLARVVVRDPASGAMGAVSHRFEVPAAAGLHTSTPVLTTRVETDGPQDKPRPALAVHRVFKPQGPLYCGFQVFGAEPGPGREARVSVGVEVRAATGRVVLKSPPTVVTPDPDGRVGRLVAFSLDGLAEGDYEVILEIVDEVSGRRVERREPFALAAAAR
jgi:VWFA-related protein